MQDIYASNHTYKKINKIIKNNSCTTLAKANHLLVTKNDYSSLTPNHYLEYPRIVFFFRFMHPELPVLIQNFMADIIMENVPLTGFKIWS